MMNYKCPYCHANLDPGEKCDCGGKAQEAPVKVVAIVDESSSMTADECLKRILRELSEARKENVYGKHL